jgi:tyrosyl-tRNA synthetase
MSKSLGNYVGVTDPPEEMFGKLMSIPDSVMGTYYELLLGEELPGTPPVEAKRALARRLTDRFHGDGAGEGAEAAFDRVHVAGDVPEDLPVVSLDSASEIHLPALIAGAFEISSSEARRLLSQGGVKLDGEIVSGDRLDVPRDELEGKVLKVGKRRFARLES